MVQSMRSWATLQPGENASCVGCHEHKNSTPLAHRPLTSAMAAGAEPLAPFFSPPRGFSFVKDVQPILDRHCVRCHDGPSGKPPNLSAQEVLDARAKRRWNRAYLSLTHAKLIEGVEGPKGWHADPDHPMLNWISAQSAPPMQPPYSAGSNHSGLIELLDKGHEGVRLSREESDRLAAWIDLGVPFCGDYVEANTWSPEEMEKYEHFLAKRKRLAAEEQATINALARQAGAERPPVEPQR
jgi:hypothetical protein